MAERTLYHITHRSNLQEILLRGLRPRKARTKWATVWLCAEERIADLITHMGQRHGWSTGSLIVIRVTISDRHLRRNRAPGVYHFPYEIIVSREDAFAWERGGLVGLNDR